MNIDDIRKIELELNIELPQHFIDYITNYPIELTKLKTMLGELLFLYDDPEQLISINQYLGFYGSEKLIKQKLCIGENGGGDYYLINLKELSDEKVYFWDHEESTERFYNEKTDTWEWEKLEFSKNLKEHEKEILEIFGQ
ncbi:SMI1/KNR4 family protein [Flammeovirga sp. SJP92]|uniref:SMI1/KNR4 family protein n=1 Tax=Flammeovirga sp. SJP92 TaxID=1775430 RepID=UPI000787B330|nr:SMI1/KNR4 family protein [Flammeovirga sp. SJP92]KXX71141.1 hypothetical protein AVL50_09930 [Flammeovirga sp. SJP92]